MRLLILSQYFYPELISTGQLLTELAEDLSGLGCSVTVIAGQPTYYDRSRVEKEIFHNDVTILRVENTQWDKNRAVGKIFNSATFFLGALRKARTVSDDSIVLAVTNPPFLPLAACLLSLFGKRKYICLIHDLYPDIAVKLGYIRAGSAVEWFWSRINHMVWGRAEAVVVLGRDMEGRIRAKLPESDWRKIRYIPNWSDGDAIRPLAKEENDFVKKAGYSTSTFIVQYSGNMGLFHDLETIVEAAAQLTELPIKFLFIGGGGKREKIEHMAQDMGLGNVTFLPYQPKEMLRFSLACSDVSLVCLEKGVEGMAVPCKYYGILASGRPVIAMMDEHSEISTSVQETGCGIVIPQGVPGVLADKIRYLYSNPEIVKEMGKRARAAFEASYARGIISRRYFDLIREIQG